MQKELADALDVTDGYLRTRNVKRSLNQARAVHNGLYARCTVCNVAFYRAQLGVGVRKPVKRNEGK